MPPYTWFITRDSAGDRRTVYASDPMTANGFGALISEDDQPPLPREMELESSENFLYADYVTIRACLSQPRQAPSGAYCNVTTNDGSSYSGCVMGIAISQTKAQRGTNWYTARLRLNNVADIPPAT